MNSAESKGAFRVWLSRSNFSATNLTSPDPVKRKTVKQDISSPVVWTFHYRGGPETLKVPGMYESANTMVPPSNAATFDNCSGAVGARTTVDQVEEREPGKVIDS